jgi:hypothetical protein
MIQMDGLRRSRWRVMVMVMMRMRMRLMSLEAGEKEAPGPSRPNHQQPWRVLDLNLNLPELRVNRADESDEDEMRIFGSSRGRLRVA